MRPLRGTVSTASRGSTACRRRTLQDPDGHFIGWAPGRGPIIAPDGLPWRLDPSTDLVVELHLLPGKAPVAVQPQVGLYFTDKPPAGTPVLIVMGNKAIDIPAGATDYAIEDSYELPVDASVLSVYPHAHYLGKEMTVRAVLPDGGTKTLIHIPRWSFHWQQDYRYVTPIALPRGTRITMRYTYDNSDANDDNPSHPPRRVKAGPQSSDEMGNLGLQLLPRNAADAATLATSFAMHAAEIDLAGAQMLARAGAFECSEPCGGRHRAQPVAAFRRGGPPARAGRAARSGIRERAQPSRRGAPGDRTIARGGRAVPRGRGAGSARRAPALQLRAGARRRRRVRGRHRRARTGTRRSPPDFAEAHQLLGSLLFSGGRLADGLPHLKRAVEQLPDSAAAHSDYGGALAAAGQLAPAEAELRRALEIDSTYASARANLQRVLQLRAR